jgi:hypothetical protein
VSLTPPPTPPPAVVHVGYGGRPEQMVEPEHVHRFADDAALGLQLVCGRVPLGTGGAGGGAAGGGAAAAAAPVMSAPLIVVEAVEDGSQAWQQGLVPGSVLRSVQGYPVQVDPHAAVACVPLAAGWLSART